MKPIFYNSFVLALHLLLLHIMLILPGTARAQSVKMDEDFIRNLPAAEKHKAMKYNSRITMTVADSLSSTNKRSVQTILRDDTKRCGHVLRYGKAML